MKNFFASILCQNKRKFSQNCYEIEPLVLVVGKISHGKCLLARLVQKTSIYFITHVIITFFMVFLLGRARWSFGRFTPNVGPCGIGETFGPGS